MLKLFLPLFAIIILFTTSCKKDSGTGTSSDYYVKIKKNGAWVNYPIIAGELGPDLANSALTDLGVTASTTNHDETFDLTIQISGSAFATGTYNSDNFSYQTAVSFVLQNGSDLSYYDIDDAPGLSPSKYTINITSITSEAITGSFKGNYLYDSFASSAAVADITEGEFHVKRIR